MDELVARSLAKWPNVPAVYGWLALDRRGEHRIDAWTNLHVRHRGDERRGRRSRARSLRRPGRAFGAHHPRRGAAALRVHSRPEAVAFTAFRTASFLALT